MSPKQTQTQEHPEPKATVGPGCWYVNDRGEASPYIPYYIDDRGRAQPIDGALRQ